MKRLYKYVKPYLRWTLLAPLFMVLEVAMDLVQPTLMSRIIDVGIVNGDAPYVMKIAGLMILAALTGIIGGVGNMYFSTKAGFGFAKDMRSDLFHKVQYFTFANIDTFKTGSLVTRITNDVTQIQNAFTTCIRMLIRSPFLFIGGIYCVLRLNVRLALVVLAAIPVLVCLIVVIMKLAMPLFKTVQERVDRVNVVMQENLAGVRVIKAFGRSAYEKERFGHANDALMNVSLKAGRIMATFGPAMGLIMNIALVAIYWLGGGMAIAEKYGMTSGSVMAFASYITQILFSLTMSSFMLMFLSRAKVSVDRVNEVLDAKIDIEDHPGSTCAVTRGEVRFEDVTFRYPGQAGEPVLSHISFTAKPGTKTAILGATGSGKTSLVNLIPRLYDVESGRVTIDGQDVRRFELKTLRSAIGVALQESVLFTGSIAENLRWGDPNATEADLDEMTRVARADEFIGKTEKGYDTELGQRGVNLSGGQKQRMCIARALVKKPKILILDDSTSAVDLTTEAAIQDGLKEKLSGCTVFLIAQRISAALDADQIIVLDDGKIADIGTHEELKKRCDIYRQIVISQLGKEAA